MAPDNNDLLTTRDCLELLIQTDQTRSHKEKSTRNGFLAGVAFSGLLATSVFLTYFIDCEFINSKGIAPANAAVSLSSSSSVNASSSSSSSSSLNASNSSASSSLLNPSTSADAMSRVGMPSPHVRPLTPFIPKVQEEVLTPVAGLSTSRSVITGVADPVTMTASYYWTFTLKNTNTTSKEAQMRIVLPDGAVVSRATLWINGKAEEAAFNSTENVQNAYDWIVSRNRDPLLITQTDENKIKVKASPVMPKKEMKIRIGLTVPMTMSGNGTCNMTLPAIAGANLDTNCVQNIHITSTSPISANDPNMSSQTKQSEYLLRGNLTAQSMSKLQISTTRNAQLKSFATRATHSFPPSYILGELAQNSKGLSELRLSKVVTKPDCLMISDDHAAFRLSYLWAKEEIKRLIQNNNRYQAVELATIYRVVSPVSGAVVLERQSDYDYNGLDRNRYKSTSYVSSDNQQQPMQEEAFLTVPADDARGALIPPPAPKALPTAAPLNAVPVQSQLAAPTISQMGQAPNAVASARRRVEHSSEAAGKFATARSGVESVIDTEVGTTFATKAKAEPKKESKAAAQFETRFDKAQRDEASPAGAKTSEPSKPVNETTASQSSESGITGDITPEDTRTNRKSWSLATMNWPLFSIVSTVLFAAAYLCKKLFELVLRKRSRPRFID